MRTFLAAAALAAGFLTAPAMAAPKPGEEKINQLVVYGNDPCPKGGDDEIVVCARKPERERFRIPERLRGDPNARENQSWANQATALERVGRTGIGSCTPSGPGGWTGCLNNIIREARAERAGADDVNWNRLIEQARQERLSKIDAAARAEDEGTPPPPPPK